MKWLTTGIVILILGCQTGRSQSSAEKAITDLLMTQEKCWNEGDIECFMEGYWKSDSLMFIGASGITYGWGATRLGYYERYPDRKTMGSLTFTILELQKIADSAYHVVGKFHLARESGIGDLEGHFSLIFRKIDSDWLIISDHTSS